MKLIFLKIVTPVGSFLIHHQHECSVISKDCLLDAKEYEVLPRKLK